MLNLIKKIIYKGYHFSWSLEFVLFLQYILIRVFDEKSVVIQYLYKKRDYYIEKYLIKKEYVSTRITSDMITKKKKKILPTDCIWIYWAQGWEQASQHVIFCKNSVLKNSNGKRVILLSDKNYKDYVEIPSYIIEKRQQGKISTTHFSDILRFSLLADYGGLWVDASIFVNQPLSDSIFNKSFYTIRLKKDLSNNRIISKCRWIIGCMGTSKSNYKLFVLGRAFLLNYWKYEDMIIHYFWVDYFFDIILKMDKTLLNDLNSNDYSNQGIYELAIFINNNDFSILNKFENDSSNIFYLSWKKKYKKTVNLEKTIYGYLVDKYLRIEDDL